MNDRWLNSIRDRLQGENSTPPESLWEKIDDSLWENTLRNKVSNSPNQAPNTSLREHILRKRFTNLNLTNYSSLLLKSAATLSVIGGLGYYFITNKTEKVSNYKTSATQSLNESPIISQSPKRIDAENKSNKNSPALSSFSSKSATDRRRVVLNPNTSLNSKPIIETVVPQELPNQEMRSTFYESLIGRSLEPIPLAGFSTGIKPIHLPYQSKHVKNNSTPISYSIGFEKQIKGAQTMHQKEKLSLSRSPIQRDFGFSIAANIKDKWVIKTGVFQAKSSYQLNKQNVPFYKTPVRVRPAKKLIRVNSEYHKEDIDATGISFFPRGTNPTDTAKYYRIDYNEEVNFDYIDIPISFGYNQSIGRWSLGAGVGGRLFIGQSAEARLNITVKNPTNHQLNFVKTKDIRDLRLYRGFLEIYTGYRVHKNIKLTCNVLIPNVLINNSTYLRILNESRFLMNASYIF